MFYVFLFTIYYIAIIILRYMAIFITFIPTYIKKTYTKYMLLYIQFAHFVHKYISKPATIQYNQFFLFSFIFQFYFLYLFFLSITAASVKRITRIQSRLDVSFILLDMAGWVLNQSLLFCTLYTIVIK